MTMQYYEDAAGAVHGFDDTDASQVALMNRIAISAGWTCITGSWPPAQTQADAIALEWLAYQKEAKAALDASDTTMHRITEAVSLGLTTLTTADVVAFMQWRRDLRSILSQSQPATTPTALPTKPAYPANT